MRNLLVFAISLLLTVAALPAAPAAQTSCTACHGNEEFFSPERVAIVTAFEKDVHNIAGLSCHDCHGGNPDQALADDVAAAMDEGYRKNPYQGSPSRVEIPNSCGKCHSDPVYMRRFRPDARVDQEQEYWTSHHGQALREGDTKVATCIDCHGVHGILKADDPSSPVYPAKVAETCGACHADKEHMTGYRLPTGLELPVNQLALWKVSVHARAMFEKGDLSAPTCNDCHGNHGATPPGLESVSFVCGQCHGREAGLFRASAKRTGFSVHNEFIGDAGSQNCGTCHEVPTSFAQVPPFHSFSECASCHGNHAVVRPTIAMLSPLPEAPCDLCHGTSILGIEEEVASPVSRRRFDEVRTELISQAEQFSEVATARFDWLVDQALVLPFHTTGAGENGASALRPEFGRLFEKFRIGKTSFEYPDPVTGAVVEHPVIRCSNCHLTGDDAGVGTRIGMDYLQKMWQLTAATAGAERILLRARRGGVETRSALPEIDSAVDNQIEMQVMVHAFSPEAGETFTEKYEEGMAHARNALAAGQEALDELQFRRTGLAISLVFILGMLVGLGYWIRRIG